jgi:UDP-GlcNAc3NAcA epimerase
MKIITIIGARPQFIKAAMCSLVFAEHGISELIVHTGQHFDANMSEVFFDELSIPKPAYNLGIGGGSHGQNTGRMLEAIEQVLVSEKPDGFGVWGHGQHAGWDPGCC